MGALRPAVEAARAGVDAWRAADAAADSHRAAGREYFSTGKFFRVAEPASVRHLLFGMAAAGRALRV